MNENNIETREYGKKAIDYITHLCKIGPRITCSEEEMQAAEDLDKKLQEYCDDTYLDSFKLYPDLYPAGFIKIAFGFILIGFIFMYFNGFWSIFASILPLLGIFQIYITYLKMNEIFGFLFKKKTSINATGRIYPRNSKGEKIEAKKRVIVCGHIDSAFQMKITKYEDKLVYLIIPGFAHILIQIIFGIIKPILVVKGGVNIIVGNNYFVFTNIDLIFTLISVITLPGLFFLYRGLVGGNPVIGANDNLSGVGIAVALAEYFSKEENRLRNVELWLGGFGSEECGERGSYAFIKKYGKQGLLDSSYSIIPESCGGGDRMAIITKEPTHFATHDYELCLDIFEGYKKYVEFEKIKNPTPCKVQKLPFSASDAGRFSLNGYKASMIIAFDGKLAKPQNWHNEKDIPENLDLNVMQTVFGMYKHYILNLDEKLNNI